jgi:hypothetical protein
MMQVYDFRHDFRAETPPLVPACQDSGVAMMAPRMF